MYFVRMHRNCFAPQSKRLQSLYCIAMSRQLGTWRMNCPQLRSRTFATSTIWRKDSRPAAKPRDHAAGGRATGNMADLAPETTKRALPADHSRGRASMEKKDPLLGAEIVSNKEQRKADWAIMKEMSKYLWPKVGMDRHSVFCRLIFYRTTSEANSESDCH